MHLKLLKTYESFFMSVMSYLAECLVLLTIVFMYVMYAQE